jgi:hypothetical protein
MGLLLASFFITRAQDIIITNSSDTLTGTITRMTDQFMKITTISGNEVTIELHNVKDYQFDSSAQRDIQDLKRDNVGYSRFRVAVTGGFSYQTAAIGEMENRLEEVYMQSLKRGFALGGTFNYFFNRGIGIGLDYGISFYRPQAPLTYEIYNVEDKIVMQHFIPTFNLRALNKSNPNNYFLATLGFGYAHYADKLYMTVRPVGQKVHVMTYKGSTVVSLLRIGYDISVARNMAIVLQASLVIGGMSSIKEIDELTEKEKTYTLNEQTIGVGRLEFSIGFRFGK